MGVDAIDARIPTTHRRTALSCYAWPGLTPKACMRVYGSQIQPVLRVLLSKPIAALDAEGGTHYERAVARAEVERWHQRHDR